MGYNEDEIKDLTVLDWDKDIKSTSEYREVISGVQYEPVQFERIHTRKDNSTYIASITAVRVKIKDKDIMYAAVRDVTEIYEKKLKELHYSQIIEQTHDSVIATDLDGFITKWNRGAEKIFGYESNEVLEKSVTLLYLEEDIPTLMNHIKELKLNGEFHTQVRMISKSKNIIVADLYLSLLKDNNGIPLEMIGYSKDITIQVKAEEELKELNRSLEQKVKEGVNNLSQNQAKLAQMGSMMGMIAHQWRQPLNALSLNVQKVQVLDKADKLSHEIIETTVARSKTLIDEMSKMIDDFMNVAKKEETKTFFNLIDVFYKVESIIGGKLVDRNIVLQYNIDHLLKINSFRNEIFHVLLNIVSNAIDAFEGKEIENKKIVLQAALENNILELIIKDNAGGIPEEIREKIFDSYFTTKESGKGTGIGLDMSKKIIEDILDGTIDVHNDDDGAIFTIRIVV